jgi:hypothetical protein
MTTVQVSGRWRSHSGRDQQLTCFPAPQYGQEQPISPSTGGPQYGMSFMSDLPQYGMTGLPFSTGPQNGHSSSMDSNPRTFQYSSDAGFPLLPPYVPRAAQDVLSTEGLHQSFGDIARTADSLPLMAGEVTNSNNNPCKLIIHLMSSTPPLFYSTTTAHTTRHNRIRWETGPKAATRHNPATPLVRCAKACQTLAPDIGRAAGTCMMQLSSAVPPTLIPCHKSNLIILHEHQSLLHIPSRLRPARRWLRPPPP